MATKKTSGRQTSKLGIVSFADRLRENLRFVENKMMDLLDVSTIERRIQDPDSPIVVIGPDRSWGGTDANQTKLQLELKKAYLKWFEHFRVLFRQHPKEIQGKIQETDSFVRSWIEKEGGWDTPETIDEAKDIFRTRIKEFDDLIDTMSGGKEPKKYILVPDTNALIAESNLSRYTEVIGEDKFEAVVLPTVLAELESLKMKNIDLRIKEKIKIAIRYLKGLRKQGDPISGVKIGAEITVRWEPQEPDLQNSLGWLKNHILDDCILASTIEILRDNPDALVVLVTSDIGLQNKAAFAYIPCAEPPENLKGAKPDKKEPLRVEAKGVVDLGFDSKSAHREQIYVTIRNDDPNAITVMNIWLGFKGNKKIEMQTWGTQSLPLTIAGRDFTRHPVRCVVPYTEIDDVQKINKVSVTTSHEPRKFYYGQIENLAEFVEKLHESRIDPAYMTPEQRKQYREMMKKRMALQAKIARKNGFVGKFIGPDGWKVRP